MTRLDPVIHRAGCIPPFKMDCRVKPGNDGREEWHRFACCDVIVHTQLFPPILLS